MAERGRNLLLSGYYLSRFGKSNPPNTLKVSKWVDAYRSFYNSLNAGRSLLVFERSLKNVRDTFDGYFPETERQGWKESPKSNRPVKLSKEFIEIFKAYQNISEHEIFNELSEFIETLDDNLIKIYDDLASEEIGNSDTDRTYTEGKQRLYISRRFERDARLRKKALEIHGFKCQVCGFDFEEKYGKWGKEFAEVHHVQPFSERKESEIKTDPIKDLAVLCSNCHRMVHRKKGTTLSIEELKRKLRF